MAVSSIGRSCGRPVPLFRFYDADRQAEIHVPSGSSHSDKGYTQADVTYHNVITEWKATNPAASKFEGSRRELLRVAHVVQNLTHPFGHVEFNPTAKPGSPDIDDAMRSRGSTSKRPAGGRRR